METEARPSNGLGTAAMVIGIIALILSFIPILGLLSWILAPLAFILGFIAVLKPGAPKGGAITGLITSGFAFLICLAWVVLFGAALSTTGKGLSQNDLDQIKEVMKNDGVEMVNDSDRR
jgi:hypothetical protein